MALAKVCQECVWLTNLCREFNIIYSELVAINIDNQSTIKITKDTKFSNRTKHIVSKDLRQNEIITLKYCLSKDNVADILTKPIPIKIFKKIGWFTMNNLRRGVL